MYVNGRWIKSNSGEAIDVFDPANGDKVGEVDKGTPEDARKAVKAANEAFEEWSETGPGERAELLNDAADEVEKNLDNIAKLLTREQGKPLNEARGEVKTAANDLRYFARKGREIVGRTIPTGKQERRSIVLKQPIGPVAAITPWNYPVVLAGWKLGPALVSGCTVTLKPPCLTPLSVEAFVKCFDEAGFPPGVVNLVTGSGSEVGRALIKDPGTRKVSFTGQTSTGKQIMKDAASNVTRMTLELGGHCPFIVTSDADIEAAVENGVYRSFRNMGQICNSINRIFVEEEVYSEFLEAFVCETEKLEIGSGLENPDVDLGPMASESGLRKVKEHVKDALEKGATLGTGGEEPVGKKFDRGFYYRPTVLSDLSLDMKVMEEETFGPVAPIMKVSSLKEAVDLANEKEDGLVSYLFIGEFDRGLKVAEELEYGTVDINNVSGGSSAFPYEGWKQSGFGIELSDEGFDEYLHTKHVRIQSEGFSDGTKFN